MIPFTGFNSVNLFRVKKPYRKNVAGEDTGRNAFKSRGEKNCCTLALLVQDHAQWKLESGMTPH